MKLLQRPFTAMKSKIAFNNLLSDSGRVAGWTNDNSFARYLNKGRLFKAERLYPYCSEMCLNLSYRKFRLGWLGTVRGYKLTHRDFVKLSMSRISESKHERLFRLNKFPKSVHFPWCITVNS